MAITSRGTRRTASNDARASRLSDRSTSPEPTVFLGIQTDPTDAEIVAAVQKSADLALITGAELLEAIDATRVAGLVSAHELDLVRWEPTEGGASC